MVGEIGKSQGMFFVFVLGRVRPLDLHALGEGHATLSGALPFKVFRPQQQRGACVGGVYTI